ncbi:tyrosine recombinase XerS [Vagococcus vulneris]|uniref:Tyrosine recombinase XerS n=1 Tax=Vagococcus vulneris TaxID=1977869 RepID=A0A430A2B2_9ENTE|nr:tyrosine recombinase XerS [Vagococcus vulneris]RSU00547.1 tyrosine recombinase XerS [Vagococcus vulneris]
MANNLIYTRLQKELEALPSFVKEYIQSKSSIPYSTVTLYEYTKEFRRFFNWLYSENLTSNTLTTLDDLNRLKKEDVEAYKSYLLNAPRQGTVADGQSRSFVTIQRSITALRSLFKYLSLKTENESGVPYLSQNIFLTIENVKSGKTLKERSRSIEKKLFLDDEALGFLEFINNDYEDTLTSHQAKAAFKRNKVRDLAINALFLGTGMRLSELVNMKISDLDINNSEATIIRKGGFKDTTAISSLFIDYIANYSDRRNALYKPNTTQRYLFLTTYKGEGRQIDTSTVEKMVAKYSSAYKVRITPHKLRHTVGTQLYKKTNSLLTVSHQLGQTSTSATAIYTHIVDEEQRQAMNNLWFNK